MRGVCGIDIDKDKMFVSFCALKDRQVRLLEEIALDVYCEPQTFLQCLKQNCEALNYRIKEKEQDLSLKIEKIFVSLPQGLENKKQVEDVIPLKKIKKISPRDLAFAKKYLRDIFLEWDDFCVHNFVMNYEVEGNSYPYPPLGIRAKKIKVRALLVSVKDKLRQEVEESIDNLGKEFGGFVSSDVSMLAVSFGQGYVDKHKNSVFCVVNIGGETSQFVIYKEGKLEFSQKFDFGLKTIIQCLEKRFLLGFPLAEEVFSMYISFKNVPYFKEISIKQDYNYIKLSIQTINSFIKDYIKEEISRILEEIRDKIKEDSIMISFIGRLNQKEGFYGFIKEFLPGGMNFSFPRYNTLSSSFGCSYYGLSRFLEDNYPRSENLFHKFFNVYREYF